MTAQENANGTHVKETAAVMYNLKEQRMLEKFLQTLRLEQSYSMKLLDLNNREIKVKYRKLKDKVSKIKSYLPVEDICKLRDLDKQGKLKSASYNLVPNSAAKMAASSHSLHFNKSKPGKRFIRSALPRISIQRDTTNRNITSPASSNIIPESSILKPRFSLTEVSGDTLQRTSQLEPKIATVHQVSCQLENELSGQQTESENNNIKDGIDLPISTSLTKISGTLDPKKVFDIRKERDLPMSIETQNTLGVPWEHQGIEAKEKCRHGLRAQSAYYHSHSPFSSHAARAGMKTAPPQYNYNRRLSHVSHDSIDSNLGENLHEERRLYLLEEETLNAAVLERKTQNFLKEIAEYAQAKPHRQSQNTVIIKSRPESSPVLSRPFSTSSYKQPDRFQRRNQFSEADVKPTYLPEQQYKERLTNLWKDMNKCRYLRMPDEKIDLSGINTLAKDQMKLFHIFRNSDRPPLREAWEN